MRANRHKFFLLLLAKRHNNAMEQGKTTYLHPTRQPMTPASSKPYGCSKKVFMGKTMKQAMKIMKASTKKVLNKFIKKRAQVKK